MIDSVRILTARQFAEQKFSLPEGGRWHELHDGLPVLLSSPDDGHGTIVLNITRRLATWLQQSVSEKRYACHDVGLHVRSNPDTVYVPAITVFESDVRFSQTDMIIATEVPRLVVDVASSNDRRTDMRRRTHAFSELGVQMIWVPDPFKKEIQVLQRGRPIQALGDWQTISGGDVLPGFTMAVKDVFAQPGWWTAPRQS
ncbi:MAG: Uma2 family endonuclease [Planctomycetaceae bacterium]|nr:Uma2 family endonuclease [Planctomycetaceae bacterium]